MKYENIQLGTGNRLIKIEEPEESTHCHVCGDDADIVEIEVTELVIRNKPMMDFSRSKTAYCEDDYVNPSEVDGISDKYDVTETRSSQQV